MMATNRFNLRSRLVIGECTSLHCSTLCENHLNITHFICHHLTNDVTSFDVDEGQEIGI